jgi:hypothetical protein
MGQHNFPKKYDGSPNRDETIVPPVKLSTHIVEVVDTPIWGVFAGVLSGLIEEAYRALAVRAAREDSLILAIVQTVSTYTIEQNKAFALVVITAQRIGREDLERQRRQQLLQQGGR